ncbi:MAG: hypothetical protein N3C13_02700 [Aquificaceae bacterium]|nr:hypothetical protein [Aquificaceae bacterium]MCX8060089.1 hypothetical protein [Aquificaceae bacterium]
MLWKVQIVLVLEFLSGKELKPIVHGTIVPVANTNRARTQKIIRFSGRVLWTKKRRNLRVVHDLWFTYSSMHEAKAYRVRKTKSAWFRDCRMCCMEISCVKSFNFVSRWRSGITLLAYLYGCGVDCSLFRSLLQCHE